jgi:hypothetical protein
MSKLTWPAWFNGPNGETAICNHESEVPKGWTSGAEKLTVGPVREPAKEPAPVKEPASGGKVELDAHGHPWSADLHAASKGKTTQGLWRMKVGKRRPDPAPGYPLDL